MSALSYNDCLCQKLAILFRFNNIFLLNGKICGLWFIYKFGLMNMGYGAFTLPDTDTDTETDKL